jgi:hypothetical protein
MSVMGKYPDRITAVRVDALMRLVSRGMRVVRCPLMPRKQTKRFGEEQ